MAEKKFMEDVVSNIIAGFLSNKKQEFTLDLDNVELKTPFSKEPITLSGRVHLKIGSKKVKNRV